LARAAGWSVGIVERPGLALDLDRPEDVALYLARAGTSRTLGLLHRLGVPARLRVKAPP
jgi:2-phospho-L-lactate guanylyltransferase (CobY/MobA/RfbA family)